MIDIKVVRENPKLIKDNLKLRNSDIDVDKLIQLDERWRKLKYQEDDIRKSRNSISKKINELKKQTPDYCYMYFYGLVVHRHCICIGIHPF